MDKVLMGALNLLRFMLRKAAGRLKRNNSKE